MKNTMFCNQCQETAHNEGCTIAGVCGKNSQTSNLQDVLLIVTTYFCEVAKKARQEGIEIKNEYEDRISLNLFITITNANFDDVKITAAIHETLTYKDSLIDMLQDVSTLSKEAREKTNDILSIDAYLQSFEIPQVKDEDLQSLKSLITYALKGIAAYNKHAHALQKRSKEIDNFIQDTLTKMHIETLSLQDYIQLTMKTGECSVAAMQLLDEANTSTFEHPEITQVNIGVGKRPGILVSGHDLQDLKQLLQQSEDCGIDIYTHSEMLPAHSYPFFKKHKHLVGNYGNAWWEQKEEFASFNGPILLTTNCLVPPLASYKDRVYTTGAVGFEGCPHIKGNIGDSKDFSAIIEHAKRCIPPKELETGVINGGFAHHQVLALADQVVNAVQGGDIKKFIVMAGCDGRSKQRDYYTEFAKQLPKDTVILTAGCAKYRYNKLALGDINGIPRVLDAGQCNDSYSLVKIALALKEAFKLDDINDLPIIYNIAWYEQKAVTVLLALLYLGVKDIHLGPTIPAFLSKTVVNFLVENFGIAPIQSVEEDIKLFFPDNQVKTLVTKDTLISDIVRMNATASDILVSYGMGCMGCPASQSETLEDACLVHGLDVQELLEKFTV